jgi:hypothetical protein
VSVGSLTRRLALLSIASAGMAAGAAQPPPRQSLATDAAQLARLARRHPCPRAVPRGWTVGDSTLGRPPRCSLVLAAARAIRRAQRVGTLRGVAPDQAASVRVFGPVWRSGTTGAVREAYWSVEFLSPTHQPVRAVIFRPSGRTVVGPLVH